MASGTLGFLPKTIWWGEKPDDAVLMFFAKTAGPRASLTDLNCPEVIIFLMI